MKFILPVCLGLCAIPSLFTSTTPAPQDPQDMAKMMEKAKKYTKPGTHHEALKRFLGKWDTESRIFMGGQATPPAKGSAEFSWLMEGRWLQQKSKGSMMGRPYESASIMGYDNFRMSYVATSVSSMDTAMNRAEGDMTRDGKALLLYGTLDEYLTGEVAKMVKTVWRFKSSDEMVMEVHDLPIGEENTKVVEITYKRQK